VFTTIELEPEPEGDEEALMDFRQQTNMIQQHLQKISKE
jgi:hypothetical protein